jgi:hypothetical protein
MLNDDPALPYLIMLPKECDFSFLSPWKLGITLLGFAAEPWEEPAVSSFEIMAFVAVRRSRLSFFSFMDRYVWDLGIDYQDPLDRFCILTALVQSFAEGDFVSEVDFARKVAGPGVLICSTQRAMREFSSLTAQIEWGIADCANVYDSY